MIKGKRKYEYSIRGESDVEERAWFHGRMLGWVSHPAPPPNSLILLSACTTLSLSLSARCSFMYHVWLRGRPTLARLTASQARFNRWCHCYLIHALHPLTLYACPRSLFFSHMSAPWKFASDIAKNYHPHNLVKLLDGANNDSASRRRSLQHGA